MSGTQTTFLDNLMAAARENPIAAVLIGGGALWLLMRNETLKRAAGSASATEAPLADIGTRLRTAEKFASSPPTAPEMDYGSSHVGETVRAVGSATSDAALDAVDTVKARLDEGIRYGNETAQKIGEALPGKETLEWTQSSLSALLERQPLTLGAIGLAVGAAVAGAFRASDLEDEWIGEFSDTIKADLNVRAGTVSQSVRKASDALQAEIQDVVSESADRLRQAGSNAADAAQNANGP